MKKRLLAMVLTVAMCLSLLPVSALAANGDTSAPKDSVSTEEEDAVNITKKVETKDDGYTLTMDSYVDGDVTTTSKPLDIVLVLDSSGSMDDYITIGDKNDLSTLDTTYGGEDGMYQLDDKVGIVQAWPNMVYTYNKEGKLVWMYHKWTVGLFGPSYTDELIEVGSKENYSSGVNIRITKMNALKIAAQRFVDEVKANGTSHNIAVVDFDSNGTTKLGLTSVSKDAAIKGAITGLSASGATAADKGMQEAQNILKNSTNEKVVVFFTDGVPTTGTQFSNDVANGAISAAKTLKTDNTTIYTIGVFKDLSGDNKTKVDTYMNAVSSNYPQAQNMTTLGTKAADKYYTSVTDATALNGVFDNIATDIVTSKVNADSNSVLSDTLSDYVMFADPVNAKVYKVKATGEGTEPTWGEKTDITKDVTVETSGKTITVTGFDYTSDKNTVVKKAGTWQGYKLVVSFDVVLDTKTTPPAGEDYVDTNNTTDKKAGLTYGENDKTLLDDSPEIEVASATKEASYTVEYYKDNVKVDADTQTVKQDIWVNATTLTVDKASINTTNKYAGYKFDKTEPATIPDTIADKGVIKVYYVKDTSATKEASYTVEYYKDNVKVDADTQTVKQDIWVNATTLTVDKASINTTNKYAGYKFDKTEPATIPDTIADKGVIKVYYVKNTPATFNPGTEQFENESGKYTGIFRKTLTGKLPSSETFTITLTEIKYNTDGTSYEMTDNVYTGTVTMSAADTETFNCETMTFTQEGDYYFLVKETPGSADYITYDKNEYVLYVQVGYEEYPVVDTNGTINQEPAGSTAAGNLVVNNWYFMPGESQQQVTFTNASSYNPGGNPSHSTKYTLTYETNGGSKIDSEKYTSGSTAKLTKVPTRENYTFTGWYSDKDLTNKITEIKMTSNKTVYAGWEATEVPGMLNGDDHFAYVIGYPGGDVEPMGNITRAEVATIFFRLLNDDVRDGNLTTTNAFTDVNAGDWFNTAISTMAKLGIVNGRTADTFAPNAPITRAEFATICARFDTSIDMGASNFTDLDGHWAKDDIEHAVTLGWIMGYEDGTFRPNNLITRAEAMTMINRVLCRMPESPSDLLDGMLTWPDNMDTNKWYYLAIQEATNSHDFKKKGEVNETWTKLTENPDWSRYQ